MFRSEFLFFLIFIGLFSVGCAQGPVQTLFPAAVPLAVKTPYLNTWYQSVNGSGPLSNSWSVSWSMSVSLFLMGCETVAGIEGTGPYKLGR